MSRAPRWWRPAPQRNVRPARVRSRGRRLYTERESEVLFDLGYEAGKADQEEADRRLRDQLRRLTDAIDQGPDAIDALAREAGVMPADDAVDLVDEIERFLREQD